MTSPVDLPELPDLPDGGLPGLFEGTVPPGVYRCDSVGPDVLMQAEAAGWIGAVIDLSDVTDKAEFMNRCVTGLELPDWFGKQLGRAGRLAHRPVLVGRDERLPADDRALARLRGGGPEGRRHRRERLRGGSRLLGGA